MIQIQDDNFNQSAPAPSLNQNQNPSSDPSSNPSTGPSTTSPSDKPAEVDQLLEELDRLSKDLEEKPSAQPEEKAEEKFDFDGFLSDLEKKIDEQQTSENSSNDIKMADQTPVDFPDSGKSADIDKALGFDGLPDSTDFRKNRSSLSPQNQDENVSVDEMVNEPTDEVDPPEPPVKPETDSEELKAQNIFAMLGLEKISDEEKNKFLDDLESIIWDDFVAHDLELLLTSEEYAGAREILEKEDLGEEQQKENLIAYLEKLVPDLDEVLYDKALELKSEMMGERLAKMKENADSIVLAKIKEAEGLISQNRWRSAVSLLNQLS